MSNAAPIINAYIEESRKHPDGGAPLKQSMETRLAEIKQQSLMEKKQACPRYKAELAWAGIANQEELDKQYLTTVNDYRDGHFFLERIGRYKEVDAPLALTLMSLRQDWIQEYDVKTAPEFMLVDMALTAYFHFIRANEAINNIMANIEWNQFALDTPQFERKNGDKIYSKKENRAVAEGLAHKLMEIMEPSLDKYQRMFTRSLKAIRDLKRGNVMLNIGRVGQMNLGNNEITLNKEVD